MCSGPDLEAQSEVLPWCWAGTVAEIQRHKQGSEGDFKIHLVRIVWECRRGRSLGQKVRPGLEEQMTTGGLVCAAHLGSIQAELSLSLDEVSVFPEVVWSLSQPGLVW